MADEFVNWLDTSNSRTRFNNNNNNNNNNNLSLASISSSANNSSRLLFQDRRDKLLQTIDPGGPNVLMDHSIQVMGLGLSSHPNLDWNQSLFRNGKPDGSFGCILEEESQLGLNVNYQPESVTRQNFQWRTEPKKFSGGGDEESCLNQGLSISSTNNFQADNNLSVYENNSSSPSTMLQGFLGSSFENNHQRSIDYNYPNYATNYDMNNHSDVLLLPKFSHHFMPSTSTSSPPIQLVTPQSQLHFSNDASFWNASATTTTSTNTTTTMSDHGSSRFLPNSLHQQQLSMSPSFNPKVFKTNVSENSKSSSVAMKKSGSEGSLKRPRNDISPSSSLPAFKVKKERMGDKITALQQLVSPFGKTDATSVLHEVIDYIKFLHEQVALNYQVLSTPYMKNGAFVQQQQQHHHQGRDKTKGIDVLKQDLRSRGLCLVPISSTFPMTHETSADFWSPTFGGTFR